MIRKPGRPPGALGKEGQPEKVSNYPRLAVSVRPSTRAILDALVAVEHRPLWLVIESAVLAYLETKVSLKDRKLIESLASHRTG